MTAEGKTPTEIAAELGCHRTYVYRVLGKMSDSRKVLAMLEDMCREIREIKSMLRLLMGEARHPVTRALRRSALATSPRNGSGTTFSSEN